MTKYYEPGECPKCGSDDGEWYQPPFVQVDDVYLYFCCNTCGERWVERNEMAIMEVEYNGKHYKRESLYLPIIIDGGEDD